MTSVPKPLKFLRPHLQTLKDTYAKLKPGENKKLLADIISLLAMTDAPIDDAMPESLKYRMAPAFPSSTTLSAVTPSRGRWPV